MSVHPCRRSMLNAARGRGAVVALLLAMWSGGLSANGEVVVRLAPHQYLPPAYRDYFYHVLVRGVRERMQLHDTLRPSTCARWADTRELRGIWNAMDTRLYAGDDGWTTPPLTPAAGAAMPFYSSPSANNTGYFYFYDDDRNRTYTYNVDTVLSGSPGPRDDGRRGLQDGIGYADRNDNGQWDPDEDVWVDVDPFEYEHRQLACEGRNDGHALRFHDRDGNGSASPSASSSAEPANRSSPQSRGPTDRSRPEPTPKCGTIRCASPFWRYAQFGEGWSSGIPCAATPLPVRAISSPAHQTVPGARRIFFVRLDFICFDATVSRYASAPEQ